MLGLTRKKELAVMNETLDPKTAEMLDNIVKTQRRLEEVEYECHSLSAALDKAERENEFLRASLSACERKRDMFQRHAVALFTRLVDIIPVIRSHADIIEKALAEAKEEAIHMRTRVSPEEMEKGIQDIALQSIEPQVRKED
jgi:chromosome segregation ATPase